MPAEDEVTLSSAVNENPPSSASTNSRKDSTSQQLPADAFFLQNRLYSVIASKSLGGFELVLLHSPWHAGEDCWTGTDGDYSVIVITLTFVLLLVLAVFSSVSSLFYIATLLSRSSHNPFWIPISCAPLLSTRSPPPWLVCVS